MEVMEIEFARVLERKEYTQRKVETFFQEIQHDASRSISFQDQSSLGQSILNLNLNPYSSNEKLCHSCRKWEVPDRSIFARMFNNESDSNLYCHFCMKRVCSTDCIHSERFVIPRLFNVEYDLTAKHVCSKAGVFLQKHNFLRIHSKNPQVALR